PAREVLEPPQGHLRTTSVVHAQEQDRGTCVVAHRTHPTSSWGTTRSAARMFAKRNRASTIASSAPTTCATTKPGTASGAMPAKVSVRVRPTVTAGLAKLVDDVNQYAAAM